MHAAIEHEQSRKWSRANHLPCPDPTSGWERGRVPAAVSAWWCTRSRWARRPVVDTVSTAEDKGRRRPRRSNGRRKDNLLTWRGGDGRGQGLTADDQGDLAYERLDVSGTGVGTSQLTEFGQETRVSGGVNVGRDLGHGQRSGMYSFRVRRSRFAVAAMTEDLAGLIR